MLSRDVICVCVRTADLASLLGAKYEIYRLKEAGGLAEVDRVLRCLYPTLANEIGQPINTRARMTYTQFKILSWIAESR